MTRFPSFFPMPDEFDLGSVETLRNFAEGTIEGARRLSTLQLEAVQSALTEQTKQFRSFLENSANTTAALSQWSVLFETSAERFNQMAMYYIETASRDIMDLNQWLGQSMSSMLPFVDLTGGLFGAVAQQPPFERRVMRDRRVRAQLITFPERRAAELAKAAASAAAESARQVTGISDADPLPEEETSPVEDVEDVEPPSESVATPEPQEVMAAPPMPETPSAAPARKSEAATSAGKRSGGGRRKPT